MKTGEVHALLATLLAPWFLANGFRKGRSAGAWRKDHEGRELRARSQVSSEGWDDWAGNKFTFEFRLETGPYRECMRRLGWLVTDVDLRAAQDLHDRIVGQLARPPETYFAWMEPDMRRWYLAKFEPAGRPWTRGHDLWFRYHTDEHVRQWAAWIRGVLDGALTRFLAMTGDGTAW